MRGRPFFFFFVNWEKSDQEIGECIIRLLTVTGRVPVKAEDRKTDYFKTLWNLVTILKSFCILEQVCPPWKTVAYFSGFQSYPVSLK